MISTINYYETAGWQSKRNYSWIQCISGNVSRNSRVKCIQELNRRFRIVLNSTIDSRMDTGSGASHTISLFRMQCKKKKKKQTTKTILLCCVKTCTKFIFTLLVFNSDIHIPTHTSERIKYSPRNCVILSDINVNFILNLCSYVIMC